MSKSLGDLKTKVASWLNRSDLTSDIPDFVELAVLEIQRRLSFPYMQAVKEITITDGLKTIAETTIDTTYRIKYITQITLLETSGGRPVMRPVFLEKSKFDRAYLVEETDVFVVEPGFIFIQQEVTGASHCWTRYAGNVELYPSASGDAVGDFLSIDFIKFLLPDLTDDDYTDWLFDVGWDAILYSSLMQAEPYIFDDERIPTWRTKLKAAMLDMLKLSIVGANDGATVR